MIVLDNFVKNFVVDRARRKASFRLTEVLEILQNDSDSGEELSIDESHDPLYCEEEVDQENKLEELAFPSSSSANLQQAAGNGNVSESDSDFEIGVPSETRKCTSDGAKADRSQNSCGTYSKRKARART